MTIFDVIRNSLMAGFGVQEKMKEFVDDLVKKGELSESQGAKLVKEWTEKVEKNTEDIGKTINDTIKSTMSKMNLSTKADIEKLTEKIDTLNARMAKMEGTNKEGGQ